MSAPSLAKKSISQRKESDGWSSKTKPVMDAGIFGMALAMRSQPIVWLKSPRKIRAIPVLIFGIAKEIYIALPYKFG